MASPRLAHFRWWPRRHGVSPGLLLTQSSGREFSLHVSTTINASSEKGQNSADQDASQFHGQPSNDQSATRLSEGAMRTAKLEQYTRLLDQRRRTHGRMGVQQIWQAMCARGVDLPAGDPVLLKIWSIFLTAFMDDMVLLKELILHASAMKKRHASNFDFLYTRVMEYHLTKNPENARKLFDFMQTCDLLPGRTVSPLVKPVLASDHQLEAQIVFKHIYHLGTERDLYDMFAEEARAVGLSKRSLQRWHDFLITQGDVPSGHIRTTPMIDRLFVNDRTSQKKQARQVNCTEQRWTKETEQTNDPFDPNAPFTRERLSSVIGEIHGVKQKSVTDSFCARIFATAGISSGFMIGALSMFGLDTIGPLALRELAARGENIESFKIALRDLRDRNIAITDCVFSRAIRKFASDGRQDLFDSVVHSDRHPDTYEQRDVLERLVEADLLQDKTIDAHALLAILVMSDRDSHSAEWNLLLRAEIKNKRISRVTAIINEMLRQAQMIRYGTIRYMLDEILPTRKLGKHPPPQSSDPTKDPDTLLIVTELCLAIVSAGQEVAVTTWRELLKRHGMLGRMEELSRISSKLVEHHVRVKGSGKILDGPAQSARDMRRLQYIFGHEMQRAIVAWGFYYAPSANSHVSGSGAASRDDAWLDGIRLLARLRDTGLPINEQAVRKELILRLGIIYTPGISALNRNRALKTLNKEKLSTRIEQIKQAWRGGEGLFEFPGWLDGLTGEDRDRQLHRLLFKQTRWIRQSNIAMARKWSGPSRFPKKGVRYIDKRAIRILQHALHEERRQ
ncbi:hypothetical protein BDZ85DRAFT_260796 [Elsinoe ampelina]|uniref:Pentatricopeptide repeat domain-containing protein n=1 Tax=Elsinoe ampelina TaxID=302913 RepID=A0A6A6GFN8_9PEZI|nr:hypothetical protein BDZ85DRAFT_260796 [Elsinoe ampelina]